MGWEILTLPLRRGEMCACVCVCSGPRGANSSLWTRLSPPESHSHPSSCFPNELAPDQTPFSKLLLLNSTSIVCMSSIEICWRGAIFLWIIDIHAAAQIRHSLWSCDNQGPVLSTQLTHKHHKQPEWPFKVEGTFYNLLPFPLVHLHPFSLLLQLKVSAHLPLLWSFAQRQTNPHKLNK